MSATSQLKKTSVWITLTVLLGPYCICASAQCKSEIWDASEAWGKVVRHEKLDGFRPLVPTGTQPSFAAKLTATDWLIIYEIGKPTPNYWPRAKGFVIARKGHVLLQQSLMSASAWKTYAKTIGEEDLPAFAVYAAQVCSGNHHVVAIGFGAGGTTSSGLLFFVAVSQADRYRVIALPMAGGGKLELSQAFPLHLRLWDETNDGICNGCPQHYKISDYKIVGYKLLPMRSFTPKSRFEAGQFDPNRIVVLPRFR